LLKREFERQLENLVRKGYPEAAGLSVADYLRHIEPLRGEAERLGLPEGDLQKGRLPFVIVIKSELIPTDDAMLLVEREGKKGYVKLHPHVPGDFRVIETVPIPSGMAYLMVDVDRGRDSIDIPPVEAMKRIKRVNRSPLTIDEGVAIITQYPDFLMKNNCFSLLASRAAGNKRVPAIWINSGRRPRLGWCWDGTPHTWLGSASCGGRIGI
jgi:hypothetical protein